MVQALIQLSSSYWSLCAMEAFNYRGTRFRHAMPRCGRGHHVQHRTCLGTVATRRKSIQLTVPSYNPIVYSNVIALGMPE